MGWCDAAPERGTFAPADPGRVVKCLNVICGLGLPTDVGRPGVAEALLRAAFQTLERVNLQSHQALPR